jgi:hypothetical protein
MILEMTMRPTTASEKVDPVQTQLPDLWLQLRTDLKRQLAFSWAQLIVHSREEHDAERRHEYGRHR